MRRAVLRWRALMCCRDMVRTRKTARAVSCFTARASKRGTSLRSVPFTASLAITHSPHPSEGGVERSQT